MKCKTVMFFNLWAYFPKMYIFDVATFVLAQHLSSQFVFFFVFLVVVRTYVIYVFDEAFFPPCNQCDYD